MSQALYRKWRPARFDDVIGQEHVTRTLRNSVAAGRIGHAYLFCGPRGTGKTTTARLLAKAVNCLDEQPAERPCNTCAHCQAINEGRFLDLIEIDAASNTGVDDIRDLRDKINFSPGEGRFKVYIIDEVHMLSTAAFNALLKTLEEPPPHAKFVLATTEEHKVPATIKSRCQQFNFRLLTVPEITGRLEWLVNQEDISVQPEALQLVARHGAGSLRDAESLLDQLVMAPGDLITLERTQMVLGAASDEMVSALVDAWLDADAPAGLHLLNQALSTGVDARQFCRQMVDYLRQALLLQAVGPELVLDVPAEQQEIMLVQAERAGREQLLAAIKLFNEAALTPANNWQPQLPLELAFIELLPEEALGNRPQPMTTPTPQKARPAATKAAPPAPAKEPASTIEEPAEIATEELPAGPAPTAPQPLTLETFRARWKEMMQEIGRQDKSLPPLLNMSKPLAVEGNTLVLGFDFAVLKDKFEDKAGSAHRVAEVYSRLLDAKCQVRCVVTDQYTVPPTAGTSINERDAFYALADELGGQVHES